MIKKKGIVGKLNHADFAEWKNSINEMQKSQLKLDISSLELKLLHKEMENLTLKCQIYQATKFVTAKERVDSTKVEYEKIKSILEDKLGYSLNDKTIDEITLEVRDLSAK